MDERVSYLSMWIYGKSILWDCSCIIAVPFYVFVVCLFALSCISRSTETELHASWHHKSVIRLSKNPYTFLTVKATIKSRFIRWVVPNQSCGGHKFSKKLQFINFCMYDPGMSINCLSSLTHLWRQSVRLHIPHLSVTD